MPAHRRVVAAHDGRPAGKQVGVVGLLGGQVGTAAAGGNSHRHDGRRSAQRGKRTGQGTDVAHGIQEVHVTPRQYVVGRHAAAQPQRLNPVACALDLSAPQQQPVHVKAVRLPKLGRHRGVRVVVQRLRVNQRAVQVHHQPASHKRRHARWRTCWCHRWLTCCCCCCRCWLTCCCCCCCCCRHVGGTAGAAKWSTK